MPGESAALGLYPTASSLGTAELPLFLPEGATLRDSAAFGLYPTPLSLSVAEHFVQNTVFPIQDAFDFETIA